MSIAKLMEKNDYRLEPIQYYLRTFHAEYSMTPHSHDYFEIMYVESGEFSLFVENKGCMEHFTINEGQFVFLDSNVIHYMTVETKVKIYNFEFCLTQQSKNDLQIVQNLNNIPSVINFIKGIKSMSILNDSANVLLILKSIHSALDQDKNDLESQYLIQALIFSLLINIGKCAASSPPSAHSIYTMKTLNIIDKNLTSNLSPKRLAKKLNISESYLHRLFKENTGTTITNYINKKRIDLALILLSGTNDSIIEIAINIGFNTRQNFGQIFRKYMGMTPSEYRKSQRQKEYDIPIQQDKIFEQKSYPENKPR